MFLGVTGNSGTGQSTVASALAGQGARVCSLDSTGHRLLERQDVRTALARKLYRPELITMSGPVLREDLGRTAFSSPDTMDAIESVLHPLMKRWAALSRRLLEGSDGVYVLEGALIFEMGLERLLDTVILVTDTIQRVEKRLRERDCIDSDTVSARWARQWLLQRKKLMADHVLDNSGSIEALNDRARRLYISLTE